MLEIVLQVLGHAVCILAVFYLGFLYGLKRVLAQLRVVVDALEQDDCSTDLPDDKAANDHSPATACRVESHGNTVYVYAVDQHGEKFLGQGSTRLELALALKTTAPRVKHINVVESDANARQIMESWAQRDTNKVGSL